MLFPQENNPIKLLKKEKLLKSNSPESQIHLVKEINEKLPISKNIQENFENSPATKTYSLQLLQTLDTHKDKVWQITFHPKEDIFASCGSDKNICIWGFSNGEYILKAILEDSHSRAIRSLSWENSGYYLASASFDGCINIWRKEQLEFECISTLEGHENEVEGVAWSISGKYLASCSKDKTIWIWDIDKEYEFSCNTVIKGHNQDVKMVKWSPVDDILFSSSYDNTIKVWRYISDQEDWSCINTLTGHTSTIWSI